MGCLFFGGVNQAAHICKKKLSALWITCVYLCVILWFVNLPGAHGGATMVLLKPAPLPVSL